MLQAEGECFLESTGATSQLLPEFYDTLHRLAAAYQPAAPTQASDEMGT